MKTTIISEPNKLIEEKRDTLIEFAANLCDAQAVADIFRKHPNQELEAELGYFMDEWERVDVDAEGPNDEQACQLNNILDKYIKSISNLEKTCIEKRFEEATGRELPVYRYNNVRGCIYDGDFCTIDELCVMENVDFDLITATYDDSYDVAPGEYEPEIDEHKFLNIENEQKVITGWASDMYAESDEWHRMLFVDTDQYCNWTSERTRFKEILRDDLNRHGEINDCRRREWEEICNRYSNPCGWPPHGSIDYEDVVADV